MQFRSWLETLKHGPSRRPIRRSESPNPRRKPANRKLSVEDLEGRLVPGFLGGTDYPVGSYPTAPITGFFNNDTILDLAVANYYSGTVSVMLGNADGTFQDAVSSSTGDYPLGSYPFALDAGYFNADTNLDLVTTNAYGISVLLGNGDGTFQAPTSIDVGYYLNSVAVGDFNGDNKMDLGVVTNAYYGGGYYYGGYWTSQVKVLMGNGDGTFGAPTAVSFDYTYHYGAAAADLNGDGEDDLVTTDYFSGVVDVLLADPGSDGFQSPTNYATGAYPTSVQVHDINGDSIGDLVTSNGSSVSVLLGNSSGGTGDGTFQAPVGTNLGFYANSVAVGDFNADGKMDLVGTSNNYIVDGFYYGYYGGRYYYGHYEGRANVLLGHGNGHFSDVGATELGYGYVTGVASGDFNDGGFSDIAVANYDLSAISVLLNDESWPPLPPPALSIDDVTVAEGNSGNTDTTFTVSLEFAADHDVVVHYSTADGTAAAGSDYTGVADATVTIHKGDTSAQVTIPVLGDRSGESNETFLVNISSTDAPIGDGQGVGTIVDDEPRISINNAPAVTEGNDGSKNMTFTVTLSAAYDQDVTVHYSTADGSATAGSDYTGVGDATVTIHKGDTSATFDVAILGDRVAESNESFTVNLSGATNSLITDGSGTGTIVDDEPRITISDVSKKEGTPNGNGKNSSSTTLFVFTVSLSTVYDEDVTVHFSTANGSASAGSDYVGVTDATVTIPAGQLTATFTIVVNADKTKESDEWFAVNLSNPSSNATISDSQGIGWILDDDTHGKGKP